jgi:multidrug efflux pump subunit AcrA (membrane-fusion protein)
VRRGDIDAVITALGTTEAFTTLRLASPVAGCVTMLALRSGDAVHSGDVAVRVLPLESEAALQGFRLLEDAKVLHGDEPRLAQRLQRDLSRHDIALVVPFAALVADRLHNPGEQVAANDVLLELFDPGSLYVLAQVPVQVAASLRPGMPAEIRIGDTVTMGQVASVLASMLPQTLTVSVRLTFNQPLQTPLLHAATQCRITVAHHAGVLLVPRSALLSAVGDAAGLVMVAVGQRAEQRRVQLGLRNDRDIEVVDGLTDGDVVLVDGQYALPDDATIQPQAAPQ